MRITNINLNADGVMSVSMTVTVPLEEFAHRMDKVLENGEEAEFTYWGEELTNALRNFTVDAERALARSDT